MNFRFKLNFILCWKCIMLKILQLRLINQYLTTSCVYCNIRSSEKKSIIFPYIIFFCISRCISPIGLCYMVLEKCIDFGQLFKDYINRSCKNQNTKTKRVCSVVGVIMCQRQNRPIYQLECLKCWKFFKIPNFYLE